MNGDEKLGLASGASGAAALLHDKDFPVEDMGEEVSPLVVDAIGDALQAHFKTIAELPLPDRFLVLLAELEARERSQ